MRKEWYSEVPGGTGSDRASSWNWRRLVAVGAMVAGASLVVGVALGGLIAPGGRFGPEAVGAADPSSPPPTDIGDAVVARRSGSLEPAPTEHLVVVEVSANVCGTRSAGTGVLVADGLVLTAAHVVGDAGLVRIDHGATTVTGEVLGVLADGHDVALVAVDAPMSAPLPLAPSPPVGEPVTLVGIPGGGPRTIVVGERTVLADQVAAAVTGEAIGVDAPVTQGFSGGPALDREGTLVGIVVANETATDTALVIALAGLGRIDETVVIPGRCPTDA